MQFKIKRKTSRNLSKYAQEDLDTGFKAAKQIYSKIGDFVKAIILYDSPKNFQDKLNLLVVTDDVSFELSPELIESYRIISEKIIAQVDSRLKITTMKLSSFWEHVRVGDPITINLLRNGASLIDSGFFEPLQNLLANGRIKPTEESVWTYFYKCPRTLQKSRDYLLGATVDLYWAASNITHAALMTQGIVPPAPSHLPDFIENHLVKKGLVPKEFPKTMEALYKTSKMIIHEQITEIDGDKYDQFRKATERYVDYMEKVVSKGEALG